MKSENSPNKHRVLFYRVAFYVFFFGIVVALLFLAAVLVLSLLGSESAIAQAAQFAFGGFGVSLIVGLFASRGSAGNVRQKLFIFLWQRYNAEQTSRLTKRIIRSVINVMSEIGFSETSEQSEVMRILLNSINEKINVAPSKPKVIFIEGEPGSGKTKSVELALRNLCTEQDWANGFKRFGKCIYYYDFAGGRSNSSDLLVALNSFRFKNGMLILDNVHYLPAYDQGLESIISACKNGKSSAPSILVVVARKPQFKSLDGIEPIKLKRISNDVLQAVTRSMSSTRDTDGFVGAAADILSIEPARMNSLLAPEITCVFFQAVYMNTLKERIDLRAFESVVAAFDAENQKSSLMRKALICVASAFAFSGSARKTIVRQVIANADGSKHSRKLMRTLERAGVLSSFANVDSTKYAFHQLSARGFLRLLNSDEEDLQVVTQAFRFLRADVQNDPFLHWCYSICLEPKDADKELSTLMSKRLCGYETMKEALDFTTDIFRMAGLEHLSMQIRLCDRIGNYEEGRKAARAYYESRKDPESLFLLLLSDHWALYDDKLADEYARLETSEDPYVSLSARAWHQHIDMHTGTWDFDVFLELVLELQNQIDSINLKAYDAQEVLRRCYCDCYRVFYLQGIRESALFDSMKERLAPLRAQLESCMNDEFRDFEMKFAVANRLHYDALFEYAGLASPLSESDVFLVESHLPHGVDPMDLTVYRDIGTGSASISVRIWLAAVESYRKAYFSFLDKGDKTAMYIALRICELDPSSFCKYWNYDARRLSSDYQPSPRQLRNDEANESLVINVIKFYESFALTEGDGDGIYEYSAFGYTYIYKFLLFACTSSLTAVDDEMLERYYALAVKKHREFNPDMPNDYGIFRLNMLRALHRYRRPGMDTDDFQAYVESALKHCRHNRYCREESILEHIMTVAAPGFLNNLLFYYPVVLQ